MKTTGEVKEVMTVTSKRGVHNRPHRSQCAHLRIYKQTSQRTNLKTTEEEWLHKVKKFMANGNKRKANNYKHSAENKKKKTARKEHTSKTMVHKQ